MLSQCATVLIPLDVVVYSLTYVLWPRWTVAPVMRSLQAALSEATAAAALQELRPKWFLSLSTVLL